MGNYTQNGWGTWEITLETGGEGGNYTRNGWGRWEITLETGGEGGKLHSKRVYLVYVITELYICVCYFGTYMNISNQIHCVI